MGRNKLLLELDGETVVRRAARTAIDAGLDPVVVVTGHAHEAVAAQLHVFALTTVVNTNHGAGQHTSVAAGIAALGGQGGPAEDCAAAIVMLADMPLVTAAMVREWSPATTIPAPPWWFRGTAAMSPPPRCSTTGRSSVS